MTDKEAVLVKELMTKTEAGVVKWEETAEPKVFFTTFRGEFSVSVELRYIYPEYGDAETPPTDIVYSLVIKDSKKRLIVNLRESEIEDKGNMLQALFDIAKASAQKYVDEGIDSILKELKNPKQ